MLTPQLLLAGQNEEKDICSIDISLQDPLPTYLPYARTYFFTGSTQIAYDVKQSAKDIVDNYIKRDNEFQKASPLSSMIGYEQNKKWINTWVSNRLTSCFQSVSAQILKNLMTLSGNILNNQAYKTETLNNIETRSSSRYHNKYEKFFEVMTRSSYDLRQTPSQCPNHTAARDRFKKAHQNTARYAFEKLLTESVNETLTEKFSEIYAITNVGTTKPLQAKNANELFQAIATNNGDNIKKTTQLQRIVNFKQHTQEIWHHQTTPWNHEIANNLLMSLNDEIQAILAVTDESGNNYWDTVFTKAHERSNTYRARAIAASLFAALFAAIASNWESAVSIFGSAGAASALTALIYGVKYFSEEPEIDDNFMESGLDLYNRSRSQQDEGDDSSSSTSEAATA